MSDSFTAVDILCNYSVQADWSFYVFTFFLHFLRLKILVDSWNLLHLGVEFSFNKVVQKQINAGTIGFPLSPALANIFVGFYQNKLFSYMNKQHMYHHDISSKSLKMKKSVIIFLFH